MPVGVYTGAQTSIGNGVTTAFPYGWKILDQTHVEVKVDGVVKVLGADYSVTGVGASNGGNVVFLVAPANGTVVQRARKVPYKRDTDYQANGDFKEETVDSDFDLEEMQVQQLALDIARAFKAPLSITADQVLTDAQWAARASMMLGFDAGGAFGVFAALNQALVSAYMTTLLDDVDATTARTTLGAVAGRWPLTMGGLGFDASGVAKGGLLTGTGAGALGVKVAGNDGEMLITDSSDASGVLYVPSLPRSLAPNPFFQVNQRQIASNADDTYCFDRWYALTEANPVAASQQTLQEAAQPTNARLTQSNAAAQRMGLACIIPSDESQGWRGRLLTLRPRVRLSTGANVRVALCEWTGAADAVTSDIVNNWASGVYTPGNFFLAANLNVLGTNFGAPGAATWGEIGVGPVAVGAGCNNLILFIWTEAQVAQNVTLDMGKVRLVPGGYFRDIYLPSFGETLRYCQRFYAKTFPYSVAPAQNVENRHGCVTGYSLGATVSPTGIWRLPVEMRAAGTVVTYNPSAANANWRRSGSAADETVSGVSAGASGVYIGASTAGGTDHCLIHATSDAEL